MVRADLQKQTIERLDELVKPMIPEALDPESMGVDKKLKVLFDAIDKQRESKTRPPAEGGGRL